MLIFFFWFLLGWIVYTYAGYPVLVWFASRLCRRPVKRGDYEPTISVIVSAFNEEKWIERKIENLLALDYPSEKIEILTGSDGARDQTDERICRFETSQVRFFRFVTNRGKPHVLNALAKEARGEILLFTDVRQELAPDAAKVLTRNFADPQVGCVSGELHFKDAQAAVGKGMDFYWRYEKFLRDCESDLGSMLGATGAIYALRRHLFSPLPLDILVDDMYLPLSVVKNGFRAVFDRSAHACDRASERGLEEFKRKVRTLAGNYQIFVHFPGLFHPLKSPVAWQLFSHKFLRLLVPFLLAALFLINFFLIPVSQVYKIFFLMQIFFYQSALMEAVRDRKHDLSAGPRKRRLGYLAYTFCVLNCSAFVAFITFLNRKYHGVWEKAYS